MKRSKMLLAGLVLSASVSWIPLVHADNCGSSQRAPLPGCATHVTTDSGGKVTNYCAHAITVKVDRELATDFLQEIRASHSWSYTGGPAKNTVYCCPQYGSC